MLLQDEEEDNDGDKQVQDEPSGSDVMQDEAMSVASMDRPETKMNSKTRQHEKLYTEEGILDPRKRRAEKKRRKTNRVSKANDMDADYDFKVDYNMKDAPSEDGDDASDDEKESMAGVE